MLSTPKIQPSHKLKWKLKQLSKPKKLSKLKHLSKTKQLGGVQVNTEMLMGNYIVLGVEQYKLLLTTT